MLTARPLLWMMGIASGGVDYFDDCPRGFDWLLPLILGTDGDGWKQRRMAEVLLTIDLVEGEGRESGSNDWRMRSSGGEEQSRDSRGWQRGE